MRGVRDDRRHRRVRVFSGAAHAQLEVRDALQAARDRGPSGRILVARLPNAPVGVETLAVLANERREVRGPALLLALVEDAYAQRKRAERRAVRLQRLKPRHEVALVVRHAAAEEQPVALGRLERRRVPLLERIRRLYVV